MRFFFTKNYVYIYAMTLGDRWVKIFFFNEFFLGEVGGLVIIHKNEPNMAIG